MRSHQSTSLVLSVPQLRNNIPILHSLLFDHFGGYRIHKGRHEDLISFLVSNAIPTKCTALVLSLGGYQNNNWIVHSSLIDHFWSYRSRWGRLNNLISSPLLVCRNKSTSVDTKALLFRGYWTEDCCLIFRAILFAAATHAAQRAKLRRSVAKRAVKRVTGRIVCCPA
jgi:hypothetical protein